jgi:hypothetical protein
MRAIDGRATRLSILVLSMLALTAALAWPQSPQDPFDRALAQAGLTKATARFDYGDMNNFGGAEFQLSFFRALHGDPYKVPAYTQAVAATLKADAQKLAPLLAFGAARVDETMRRGLVSDPLADAEKKSREPAALASAIALVCEKSGRALQPEQLQQLRQAAASVPDPIAQHASFVLHACAQAYEWRQRAFARAAQRYDLQKLFSHVSANMDSDTLEDDVYDLMHLVDLKALFAGAQDLALALDRVVPELRKFTGTERFAFRWETPLGWVEINGAGNDHYPAGVKRLLTIDTGGDDTYEGGGATLAADNPVSILIDLKGNDVYHSKDPALPSFGAGVLGYGFLIDLAGKDTYTGVSFSQGSGAFGVGCLLDLEGDDRYSARLHAQGAAQFGIGILSDIAGDDHYEGFLGVQGFGATKGFGLLLDLAGKDEYVANDTKIDFPSAQTAQHNTSLAQGCGTGRRADYSDGRSLAGGIGILLDADGNDTYTAGLFAQGVGYWYGLGMLLDEHGDDRYHGIWYVQGSAAHFAVGILVDGGGNDQYQATMNMAQGAGHDFSLGFLLDKSGNDRYQAPNLSLGAGNANGIGIFWDMAGDDVYEVQGGTTMGGANYEGNGLRGTMLCLGIFLDTGGHDKYPAALKGPGNNRLWQQPPPPGAPPTAPTKGVGLDE